MGKDSLEVSSIFGHNGIVHFLYLGFEVAFCQENHTRKFPKHLIAQVIAFVAILDWDIVRWISLEFGHGHKVDSLDCNWKTGKEMFHRRILIRQSFPISIFKHCFRAGKKS